MKTSPENISKIVFNYLGISPEEQTKDKLAEARQFSVYFIKKLNGVFFSERYIAEKLGYKTRDSVNYAYKTIINLLSVDFKYREKERQLDSVINKIINQL